MGSCNQGWAQNVESTENAHVAQLKRDASTIALQADMTLVHNLWYAKCIDFLSQVWYVCMAFGVMIQDDLICNVVWCYGTCLQASLLFLFCLKALFFFLYGHFAKCTNQDSYCAYAETNLRHKGWHDIDMMWYVCNVWCRSLMCTSNVAGNTQMARLDGQVT